MTHMRRPKTQDSYEAPHAYEAPPRLIRGASPQQELGCEPRSSAACGPASPTHPRSLSRDRLPSKSTARHTAAEAAGGRAGGGGGGWQRVQLRAQLRGGGQLRHPPLGPRRPPRPPLLVRPPASARVCACPCQRACRIARAVSFCPMPARQAAEAWPRRPREAGATHGRRRHGPDSVRPGRAHRARSTDRWAQRGTR